ncbi:MAG: hypothetical protein Q7S09_03760 [bacterium]|nr:hypothetical protein [bacterium]
MSLTPTQQTTDALNRSSRILIAPAAEFSGDAMAAAFALGKALEGAGKEVCVLMGEDVPQRFAFLPKPSQVSQFISFDREYVLSVDTRMVPIKDLRYEQHEDALRLYMTAPAHFTRDHIVFEPGPHRHDILVTVGASDLEALGATFEKYAQTFFDVPVLNMDHNAANERYGNINLIDVTAATVCEVIHQFLETWNSALLTQDIATCLLAGIIDGTKSFQNVSVTPRTLETAAKLLGQGASQTDVVQYLYKSRDLNQLKLWGRILGKLEVIEQHQTAYAILAKEDFPAIDINLKDLPQILEDLHTHFSHFTAIALFFMHRNGDAQPRVRALVSSREEQLLERTVQGFGAKRRGAITSFALDVKTPEEAPAQFLERCFV